MKRKLSISIEEQTFSNIEKFVKEGVFRNKSHMVEFVLNRFLVRRKNEKL